MSNDVDPGVVVAVKKAGASDISRFYYKKHSCASKRSSLSLDAVIVALLMVKFGSDQKLRKWVAAQAKIAQDNGLETNKSVSRAVQENAIRIIADPLLVDKLSEQDMAEFTKQSMMAPWLGQGPNKTAASQPKRL